MTKLVALPQSPTPRNHPIDHYFEIFILAKKTEGLQPRTLHDHKNHYRYFQLWLVSYYPDLELKDVKADHLRQYVHYMMNEQQQFANHPSLHTHIKKQGLSPATVNIRTRSLRCFFKFLYHEGYTEQDIAKRIKLQKVDKDTIGAFSKEQMLQILAAPNQRDSTGFRDYVLLNLLFDTGLRIKEALSVTWQHIQQDPLTLIVSASIAKNGTSRTVLLTKRTLSLLMQLREANQAQHKLLKSEYLFLLNNGHPLKYHQAYERIRQYGVSAGITGVRVSPHTFRHTFAKMYMLNGGDLFILQKILAHHDIFPWSGSKPEVRAFIHFYNVRQIYPPVPRAGSRKPAGRITWAVTINPR